MNSLFTKKCHCRNFEKFESARKCVRFSTGAGKLFTILCIYGIVQ